ncbi:hypothetical protein PP178_10110 [Zeaxanthinibacter sp. PT1]|uniref:hypothetical protein n=1 Tax=Zeaxanthinibacter TaxID=561554 RepID=UPI00234A1E59|nr:hypothetical protein [Zeaxanthinibacter sp. PT1]MDC6351908.1 hypothetical protein [Zeaxanthinibacter sp. PT1]
MEQQIKLIWDFRGPDALPVARHHHKHLQEYMVNEGLSPQVAGHKELGPAHSIAFMVVTASKMPEVRDALKPHRGELHQP